MGSGMTTTGSARFAAIACTLALVTPVPGFAQFARTFSESGIEGSDVSMAGAAAEQLLNESAPAMGQRIEWQNPETGSAGQVEITAVRNAPRCIDLRHVVNARDNVERVVNASRCQDALGNWVLETD